MKAMPCATPHLSFAINFYGAVPSSESFSMPPDSMLESATNKQFPLNRSPCGIQLMGKSTIRQAVASKIMPLLVIQSSYTA